MKRVFKRILSCAIALVVLSASAVTFYALQTKAASGVTIYFKNSMNWANVYCYMYYGSGDNGPAWPGTAMTNLGNGWYSMTYTGTNPVDPIFTNNTGDQTSNCAEQAATNQTLYYVANGKTSVNAISHATNYDVNVYTDAASAGYGTTIYFKNTMNWADVYCYMYYGSGDNGPAWPGVKMTGLGNGWYSMTYTGTNPIDPIFNDNKGDQTSNCAEQAITNSALYYVPNGKSSENAISHNTNYDVDVFTDAASAGYSTTTVTSSSSTPSSSSGSSSTPSSSSSSSAVSSSSGSTVSSSAAAVASPKTGDAGSVVSGSVVAIAALALCIVFANKKSK